MPLLPAEMTTLDEKVFFPHEINFMYLKYECFVPKRSFTINNYAQSHSRDQIGLYSAFKNTTTYVNMINHAARDPSADLDQVT